MSCCVDGCLTGMTESEKISLFSRIRRKLGAPVVGVELFDEQIEECVCEAIEEYSSYVNNWFLENKMSQMLGLPSEIDFTLKYVSNNFGFEKSFAIAYSEQVGVGTNSPRELKFASISLTAQTQDYFIPANREVNEVMWYTPSFINLYGLDPWANSNIDFSEFGASYAGYSMAAVMPVFDTVLNGQAAKLRNKVRGSEYSYRLIGGPNGTKRLTLYPIPRVSASGATGNTDTGVYGGIGYQTPGTVFYQYYDTIGLAGNPNLSGNTGVFGQTGTTTIGNGLVSSPADAKLYNFIFDSLNDIAKTWIKKYAQANAKELLGLGIRTKFSSLPVPGAEVTLNGESLISNGRADMEFLRTNLKEQLDKLNYKSILENNAIIQESVNKTLGFGPLGIYIG